MQNHEHIGSDLAFFMITLFTVARKHVREENHEFLYQFWGALEIFKF